MLEDSNLVVGHTVGEKSRAEIVTGTHDEGKIASGGYPTLVKNFFSEIPIS